MTYPNDPNENPRRRVDRDGSGSSMMWAAILGALALVAVLVYTMSDRTNVASNDTSTSSSATRVAPPAATTPAPVGTTGISPNPTPAPPAR